MSINIVKAALRCVFEARPFSGLQFALLTFLLLLTVQGQELDSLQAAPPVLTPVNIGGSGQLTNVVGGYNISASGADIGDTTDHFHFSYQRRTGDFDVRTRIAGISITDPFMHAGLMARETLAADSRFTAAFASSPQLGAFHEARQTVGTKAASAAPGGHFPANYPHMWLRLQRAANQFTSFASLDGEIWTQLGSATISLPSTVNLGLAVASGKTNVAATVEFREYGDVTSGATGPLQYGRERLGPSSRRTGLVISEIMYNPPERADGKDLEFIEIYNGGMIFEDLDGFRLSGSVEYVFPPNTRLEAGAFIVVAKVPADFRAVYGSVNPAGPFTGALENSGGVVRLEDARGHVLLEANFSDAIGWPVAADGAGCSLVLARPSYGERDARAWAASTFIGGSPGGTDPVVPIAAANVFINEFLAHTDAPQVDFVELYNHGNDPVDLSGCWLSDEAGTNKFRIPNGTVIPERGYLAFDEAVLGFALSSDGEQILLVSADGTRVLDGLKFSAQENGVSSGRSPDGASSIRRLGSVTRGAANSRWRGSELVISEIMYNPISGDNDDEFVEIHNAGSQSVNLAGWKLTGGIEFDFPNAATIPAGGYLVVGRDAERLRSNYPQLNNSNTLGDYSGSLRNSGDRIALSMPDQLTITNDLGQVIQRTIYIDITEVTYSDGGRWSPWADGGGSSLELIDPRADPAQADNWRESDETNKAQWSTVEFTGTLDHGSGTYSPVNQLHVTLQGAGECLVDDVQVLENGFNYVVTNGNFQNGTTGWVFQGNHSGSTVENGALHIRAPGRGDTGGNRIRTALRVDTAGGRTLVNGNVATIRARVRWLKGWPEILLRLRGNWLECAARMSIPSNLGTPGMANSRAIQNAGPAIYELSHHPVVPAAGQAVVVTARASDPDNVTTLNLRFRIDPSATVSSVAMRDNGSGGDAVAGDGLYSATITGRPAGTLVAFHVEAIDSSSARSIYPAAPAQECLIRWGERIRFGTLATYLMWATKQTADSWSSSDDKNNTYRNVTFVYNGERVVHNAGVKDKGSPFHSGGGDALLVLPEDEKVIGATDFAICSTGNAGDEVTLQREQLIMWIGREMGANYLNRRPIHFIYNGSAFKQRRIMEDAEEPNGDYSRASVPQAGGGDLYKVEDWFEFNDAASSFEHRDATLQVATTTGGGYKTARYRWMFRKRAVENSANNYTNLFDLVSAVNNVGGGDYVSRVESLVNVRGWMAVFAMQRIAGNWDSYGFNRGKNAYLYKGEGLRWEMFPWDIDFVLWSGSNDPSDALWGGGDPAINRMFNNVTFRRVLWQAYLEAATGPLTRERYLPQMMERYRIYLANGVPGVVSPLTDRVASYIDARRNKIMNDLNTANTSALTISTASGNDFSTNKAVLNLTGLAPFAVHTIEVNGIPYRPTWSSVTGWSISIPLAAPRTTLNVTGRDRHGNVIPGISDTVTVTYTGTLYEPEDYLVLNEIMYNPALPDASFVELFNSSLQASFDLSNWRLDGIGYTFPEGTVLAPNSYLVLAQDLAGFAAAYGAQLVPFGEFPGSLDNGGETLRLVRPGPAPNEEEIIDQVRYDDDAPWPVVADGFGPSLQLMDAGQDNWPVANWAATATNSSTRATPGAANALRAALVSFPTIYINEVLPNNVTGTADSAGEREPWIELINTGSATVDLSGLYLSDSYANLTKWQFPAGTTLSPGQFLTVWADGETAESVPAQLHTNFRLNPSSGSIALSRLQNSQPAVVDYLSYSLLGAGRSYGSYPDGQPGRGRILHFPTFNAPNNPASVPVNIFINEWQAGNTQIADPADDDFDDWVELYNASSNSVDLSGYFLTDNLEDTAKYTIPNGKVIPPGGHLIVWADEETDQNTAGADIHSNFKLSLGGEEIGLFGPDGTLVDSITFGAQAEDLSEGRALDGEPPPFVRFTSPTPGEANAVATDNLPPVLAPVGNKSAAEGVALTFQVQATDQNSGQTISYSVMNGPDGAVIDSASGVFSWTPSETEGPGTYFLTIRATDNGSPARSATERIQIDVSEVNRAPSVATISSAEVDEGSALELVITGTDPDLPANTLNYSLEPGAPDGVELEASTGRLSWVPAENQGPGDYNISVRVTDNGNPPLGSVTTFGVHVNEANNLPVLDLVLPQIINEGDNLTIHARAVDQDTPPAPMIYSLEGAVPAGMQIDPASGVLTWVTSEPNGPSTNYITIRATEKNQDQLSASQSFTVIVNEVNSAPTLESLPVQFVTDGQLFELAVPARDSDRPDQALQYQLSSTAPAGLTIDSATGLIRWLVPIDHPPGTNTVSIRVSDPGELSARTSFEIVVTRGVHVMINEVMYAPPAENGEYIELLNNSRLVNWDVSGWTLEGENLRFTFPANSFVAPGGFLVIARNRQVFASSYGAMVPVFGEWTGELGSTGDRLHLVHSDGQTVIDTVTFEDSAPWPVRTAGTSLQLIDPSQDNNRSANWQSTAGFSGEMKLVNMTDRWSFNQEDTDLGSAWRQPAYNDSGWASGPALLYVESSALPAPKSTLLTRGPTTFYFRKKFQLSARPSGAQLTLSTILDDGAIFYLNGVEIYRLGMPAGAVAHDTFANLLVDNAVLRGPFTISGDALLAGENTLAVEVHQINTGSSDVVFGCTLDLTGGQVAVRTPGAANSVSATVQPFETLYLNEILTVNTSGISDQAGEREPWLELYNNGTAPIALSEMFLSSSYSDLTRWRFPVDAALAPGEYRVVWLDGEPAESQASGWHTTFRAAPSGSVILSTTRNSQPVVLDYINFDTLPEDRSFGFAPVNPLDTRLLMEPTPGAENRTGPVARPVISARLTQSGCALTWTCEIGRRYQLLAQDVLGVGAWRALTEVTAGGTNATFIDTSAGSAARFYRIELLP